MAYTEINALYDRVFNRFENEDLISKAEVLQMIANAPAADVVEVVRCKDCEHLRIINGKGLYAYCPKTECKFEPFETDTRTHFCSYGKRKEGAEE
jgi:hypothetical protein